MPDFSWQDRAACRSEDLTLFFGPPGERQPEREVRERDAKAICARCEVRLRCLRHAETYPEREGVWGGLNEDERASQRRRGLKRASYHRNKEAA